MTITTNKLLKHLQEHLYCKLGVSPVHGIGVFAIRSIEKGSYPLKTIIKYEDINIKPDELKKLPPSLRKMINTFCYVDGKRAEIPSIGLNTMHLSLYLNHSKKPNLRFNSDCELVAIRKVAKGKELFIDYDISFGDEHDFDH